MLDTKTIDDLVRRLEGARQTQTPILQCSKTHPRMNLDDAYAVQHAWVAQSLAKGRVLQGYKIGLTSKPTQLAFFADEPTYAPLLDDVFFCGGEALPLSQFISPKLEAELVFEFRKSVDPAAATVDAILDAVDAVRPALEIIDSRFDVIDLKTGSGRTVVDQVADFGTCAGVILGDRSFPLGGLDLERVEATVSRNGSPEESGVSSAVMGSPVNAIRWLVKQLASHGRRLEAGQRVLSGTFTKPVPLVAGDGIDVDYGPLGRVAFHCAC